MARDDGDSGGERVLTRGRVAARRVFLDFKRGYLQSNVPSDALGAHLVLFQWLFVAMWLSSVGVVF